MAQPMETVAAGLTAELTGTRHYQEGIFIGVGGQRLDLYKCRFHPERSHTFGDLFAIGRCELCQQVVADWACMLPKSRNLNMAEREL